MSAVVADATIMLRRNLRHMRRYPSLIVMLVGQPIVFLLLFVYVFGGTMGAGLPGASADGATAGGGRATYLTYIAPAILVMTLCSIALGTAVSVASDMTEGIVNRFRTMPIARSSVLTGHVLGALIQNTFALVVVLAVAVLLGYRPDAGVLGWLALAGLMLLLAVALTWLSVGLGLAAKSVETASNTPLPLMLLPFLSSGFVPTESMPTGVGWVAEHQPFTPVISTVRALLAGQPVGNDGWIAVVWCVGVAVLATWWSLRLYNRRTTA